MNKSKLKRALILGCALFLGTSPEGYVSAAGDITYEEGFVVDEDHKGVVRPIRPAEVLVIRFPVFGSKKREEGKRYRDFS